MTNEAAARTDLLQDGETLRLRRIHAGLNQKDLADKAGLHQSHISLLESGDRSATPRTLARLADALGCKVSDLLAEGNGETAA